MDIDFSNSKNIKIEPKQLEKFKYIVITENIIYLCKDKFEASDLLSGKEGGYGILDCNIYPINDTLLKSLQDIDTYERSIRMKARSTQ